MTSDQCRTARETLNLTHRELSRAAEVPPWFAALEDGAEDSVFVSGYEAEIRQALQVAPIELVLTLLGGLESLVGGPLGLALKVPAQRIAPASPGP